MILDCLIILVLAVVTVVVNGQLDSLGFVSIDCGIPAKTTTIEKGTGLTYVSDEQFIDTGVNSQIQSRYANNIRQELLTVRSFPNGTRNCYTLRSLTVGSKYLVRASFMYGNYDNLNKLPVFDIHLGINYWDTFSETSADDFYYSEIIAEVNDDYLQVCLINKKQGTPFISWLDLRPLDTNIYQYANSTYSLVLAVNRLNLGASHYPLVRYPEDPYDRIWLNYTLDTWTEISTSSTVPSDKAFKTPSIVMQTAATTSSTRESLSIPWSSNNESTIFFVVLHISEIQNIPSSDYREFYILGNGLGIHGIGTFAPEKLYSGWATYIHTGHTEYNVSLVATSNSTLPPVLNAFELYRLVPVTGVPTYSGDVTAMNAIKAYYKVNKGWSGDPCAPKELSWSGVTCTSDSSNAPRITTLDLSSSGLKGVIVSSFGNLSALNSLDLSDNDLSGSLPSYLDELTALTYLDITGNNNISSTLPPGLQKKQQAGTLTFKFGNSTQPSKKKKTSVVLIAVVVVVVFLLLGAISAIILVVCWKRNKIAKAAYDIKSSRKMRQTLGTAFNKKRKELSEDPINIPKPVESYGSTPLANHYASSPGVNSPYTTNTSQNYANISKQNEVQGMLNFENRQFTYNDIVNITNNFHSNIGTGGFGSVYVGILENGTQVAVKMRSHSSSQGFKQFLAEAQNLTRVHHKNLVALLGYCMDGDRMALVYEYMKEGTLQDKLRDNGRIFTWKQRLQIAYESAQGLEYLHKACNPPLIHRDVKTNNILLNSNLEAKIADFGLSRAFNNASHVSTAVVGTPGYIDPEYYSSYQLSEKSDVFSFGVVLLEIITGKPPIIQGPDGGHVAKWVTQKLSRGDIESIVDPRMQGQYDINSLWKVTELARKCTDPSSVQRPTMSGTVSELKESLDLEISTEHTRSRGTTYINPQNYSKNDNYVSDVSQNSTLEMAYMQDMPAPGPTAR